MKFEIQNDQLLVVVKQKGAEFAGIKSKASDTEYLWNADPAHWGRHSSLLFPFIGKLKNDEYVVDGKKYSLPQHGFARNADFELEQQSDSRISLVLHSSEETLKVYPFPFLLRATYELEANKLSIVYEVENPSDQPIYFSIGAHPAFNCPIDSSKKRSDYQLVFNQKETADRWLLGEGGLITGKTEPVLNNQNTLPITDALFDRDALIFDGLNSDEISIQLGDSNPKVKVGFKNFPQMGIWSKSAQSPFVCIEPWAGVADTTDHDGDFTKKRGVVKLDGKQLFSCTHTVNIVE